MDLIERYVNEVGRKLPRKGRADIKAELYSTLHDMADDRYKGQGTEDELAEMLTEFGSPDKIAASYRPAGQYLIGPELYPFFKMVTLAVLGALTIALLVAFTFSSIFGEVEPYELGKTLLKMISSLFQAYASGFASVVIVFAILQYLGANRWGFKADDTKDEEWDPNSLPTAKDVDLVSRGESVVAIAVSIVFLILLNLFADRIGFVIRWGDEPMFTNILRDNLLWLNLAMALSVGLNLILLAQGHWRFYTRLAKVGLDLFWIFVVSQIVSSIAAEKAAMVAAGFVEPLPTVFVAIGYLVIVIMVIGFIVNLVKWIVSAVRRTVSDESLAPKLG